MKIDRADALAKMIEAARAANEVVMRVYGEPDPGTEMKGPNDPVTRADKEANAVILSILEKSIPGIPIVAEESDPSKFAGFADEKVALFVDPVDGTRDFIARTGEFCVMIGLAEEGRPTIGVVHCPEFAKGVYVAAEGIGAFVIDDAGTKTPIHVSDITDLAQVRCAVSRFHRSKSVDAKLSTLGVKELVPVGSSGIKGIVVASSKIELYAHPSRGNVKLWDACAPDAIVRVAGGTYSDSHGVPFDYRGAVAQGRGTVGASPALHAEVIRRFVEYEKNNPA